MNINTIFFLILTIFRAVIAVLLTRTGYHKESRPVLWLAGLFYFNIATSLSSAGVIIDPIILGFFQLGTQVCLVLFIHTTFFADRRSPMPYFMGLTLLLQAFAMVATATGISFFISNTISVAFLRGLGNIANWTWHAIVAWNAYKIISSDKYVQDWVKARYQLMIAYCLIFMIPVVLNIFVTILPTFISIPTFLVAFSALVLQYLVWGMPAPFRKWLNRNYKSSSSVDLEKYMAMSEEELLQISQK